jgi:hypothetical protein
MFRFVMLCVGSLCLGLLGCGGDGVNGINGSSYLVTTVEASADDCPNGGTLIQAGLDANSDGTLGADEVAATSTICNGIEGSAGVGVSGEAGAAGESGAAGLSALIETAAASEDECPNGGTVVSTGLDSNGNDELDDDEVLNSQLLCDPPEVLSRETELGSSDSECPFGGIRTEHGTDDNGNDMLDDDEVDAEMTSVVCDTIPPFDTPPTGAEGTATIALNGGEGTDGPGGSGGSVELELDSGSRGHIAVYNTGVADTTVEIPEYEVNLGSNPLIVSESLEVIEEIDEGAGAYFRDGFLYDTDDVPITGIHVQPDATLALSAFGTVEVAVRHDIHNEGTIIATDMGDTDYPMDLSLTSANFYGTEGSSIDLAFALDGDGRHLSVSAEFGHEFPLGQMINAGTINTSGADSEGDAGHGGDITLYAAEVYLLGDIDATGGDNTANDDLSGAGGNIEITGGRVVIVGDLDLSGGSSTSGGGTTGRGGAGGRFSADISGDFISSGNLACQGGHGSADSGAGGEIDVDVVGGDIRVSGDLNTQGGDCDNDTGGQGGTIELSTYYDSGVFSDLYRPAGDIVLSGNVEASGGDGESGGAGGELIVRLDAEYLPLGQQIVLLGYVQMTLNGGAGEMSGGNGGAVEFSNEYGEDDNGYYASGGIVSYVDISADGGRAEDDDGGDAGRVTFTTDDDYGIPYYAPPEHPERVRNYGDISLNGGAGADGGLGGELYFGASHGLENDGDISLNGGVSHDHSDSRSGGNGGTLSFYGEFAGLSNTGAIDAYGGDAGGEADGGHGGVVEIVHASVTNQGDIDLTGGAGGDAGGLGGDGGSIVMISLDGAVVQDGEVSVSAGLGTPAGEDGSVVVREIGD